MANLLLLLILVSAIAVNVQLKQIIMTNAEFLAQFTALVDQLVKALAEITSEIAGMDNVPQATVDKLAAAQAVAQQLDDLNPDTPTPNP
jgi:hypothetical protein